LLRIATNEIASFLFYISQTENQNGNVQVSGTVRQTELTNLREYINYNITVFASTWKDVGPASDPVIVVRTDQDSKLFVMSNVSSSVHGGYFFVFKSLYINYRHWEDFLVPTFC